MGVHTQSRIVTSQEMNKKLGIYCSSCTLIPQLEAQSTNKQKDVRA